MQRDRRTGQVALRPNYIAPVHMGQTRHHCQATLGQTDPRQISKYSSSQVRRTCITSRYTIK